MAWTFAALKAADAALVGAPLSLAAAVVQLNLQTVVNVPLDVPWPAIRDVLMSNWDWGTLVQASNAPVGATLPGGAVQTLPIQTAATAIRECCIYGGQFTSSNLVFWNRLVVAANLLTPVAVGAISSASANAVVALRMPVILAWMPLVTAGDIQTARAQP